VRHELVIATGDYDCSELVEKEYDSYAACVLFRLCPFWKQWVASLAQGIERIRKVISELVQEPHSDLTTT
jgi:hypothetical protein